MFSQEEYSLTKTICCMKMFDGITLPPFTTDTMIVVILLHHGQNDGGILAILILSLPFFFLSRQDKMTDLFYSDSIHQ